MPTQLPLNQMRCITQLPVCYVYALSMSVQPVMYASTPSMCYVAENVKYVNSCLVIISRALGNASGVQ